MNKNDLTLEILRMVTKELKTLNDQLVYVGGSTISLYVTETSAVSIRETNDVDCVVEVSHRNEYETFAKQLRKIGFNEDTDGKVLCRFKKGSLILDVMPTDTKILGFTNQWYADGYKKSNLVKLDSQEIRAFRIEYLIASKFEAFKGRGKGDYRTSHDIEDIVTLFDGRETIAEDLKKAEASVNSYIKQHLEMMIKSSNFVDSLDAHISDRGNIENRKQIVINRIKAFLK